MTLFILNFTAGTDGINMTDIYTENITYGKLLKCLKNLPEEVLEQEVLFWDRDEGKAFQMSGISVFDERHTPSERNLFYLDFNYHEGWY